MLQTLDNVVLLPCSGEVSVSCLQGHALSFTNSTWQLLQHTTSAIKTWAQELLTRAWGLHTHTESPSPNPRLPSGRSDPHPPAPRPWLYTAGVGQTNFHWKWTGLFFPLSADCFNRLPVVKTLCFLPVVLVPAGRRARTSLCLCTWVFYCKSLKTVALTPGLNKLCNL